MKGLLKSVFYASFANIKAFAVCMLFAGIFAAAMDNSIQTLLIAYMQISIVGFPVSSLGGMQNEYASRWGRYNLTAPVRRAEIVASHFISLLGWLAVGMVFAGAVAGASFLLHGFPFDRTIDTFMIFILGVSITLFTGAIFFPLYYLGGNGVLGISLLGGIAASLSLVSLCNLALGENWSNSKLVLAGLGILACAGTAFGLSYPLAVRIFRKKDV